MAAIGALLLFLSFVPIVGIIGIILLIIGIKGLAEYYKDQNIYQHALKGLIFGIIGIVAVSVISLLGFIGSIFTLGLAGAVSGILVIVLAAVVAFIFYLLMAMNFRRAFDLLAERSGEHMFHTAGTLLFWGAVLTIILVGLVLVWIAWLIVAIAFFSMKLGSTQPYGQQQAYGYTTPPPPTVTPPSTQSTRYCPNCGAPVQAGATFCPNCGKPLPPT